MNARFSEIRNCELLTINGPIGKIVDVLVEDEYWMVRYLVVSVQDTSKARSEQVLISPAAISNLELDAGVVKTELGDEDIQTSPLIDDEQPISRQHELALVEHYGWPVYWLGRVVLPPQQLEALASDGPLVNESSVSNLRSAAEICGYQIRSKNGKAGTMKDLVINLDKWSVDNGVAESSTWLPSESCMFWINHIDSVDWLKREITVDLSREVLQPESLMKLSFPSAQRAGKGVLAQRAAF